MLIILISLHGQDILGALGYDVLISSFEPYYELAEYLARYTDGLIAWQSGCQAFVRLPMENTTWTCPVAFLNPLVVCSNDR